MLFAKIKKKGTKIEQEETKLLQYADDTTAVLSALNWAQYLFQQLGFFKTLSGLDINNSKTEGLWIGAIKGIKPLGIKWPSEPIKALGIVFIYDHFTTLLLYYSMKRTSKIELIV